MVAALKDHEAAAGEADCTTRAARGEGKGEGEASAM